MNWVEMNHSVTEAGGILVAVSKRQPLDRVQALYRQGCRTLGENYIEGLEERSSQFPDCHLHYIGTIQRRKLRRIIERAAWIHGLTRMEELATAAKIEEETGLRRHYLMQVHIGGEASKGGVEPEAVADTWQAWRTQWPQLQLVGLMMIGPPREQEKALRADFGRLCNLRDQIALKDTDCRELSMGMSSDWQIALAEGATMVRVGSALFGARPY